MTSAKPRSLKKDFSQEWKGTYGGVSDAGTFVARTQAEWDKLWSAAHSAQSPIPAAPKLPEGKIAVGIFAGQSSSPHDINVTRIEDDGTQATIHWKASGRAQGGGMMTTVMHDPFLLKFIEKSDSKISFQRDAASYCEISPPGINMKNAKKILQPPKQ